MRDFMINLFKQWKLLLASLFLFYFALIFSFFLRVVLTMSFGVSTMLAFILCFFVALSIAAIPIFQLSKGLEDNKTISKEKALLFKSIVLISYAVLILLLMFL